MAYIPPDSNNLPFNFTESGYTPPSDELLFNFAKPGQISNLTAAIQVMQLYQDETYTYKKYCPTYVVGYSGGRVQLIKGPCVFGGIRDLRATITGTDYFMPRESLPAIIAAHAPENLPASIVPIAIIGAGNISAYVGAHDPSNLQAIIDTHSPRDLAAFIGTHLPGDLTAYLNVKKLAGQGDLYADIGTHLPKDLVAFIDTHSPSSILGSIRAWKTTYRDLGGFLTGEKRKGYGDLWAEVSTHPPGDLGAYIDFLPLPVSLPAAIKIWFRENSLDLSVSLLSWAAGDLGSIIGVHNPIDLTAEIIGLRRPAVDLPAHLHGWQEINLGASFKGTHLPTDLKAYLDVRQHVYSDISAAIRGWQIGNLPAFLNTVFFKNLGSYLNIVQPEDLSAYIRVQPHKDLSAVTHVWHTRDLSAEMSFRYYRDLPATIIVEADIGHRLLASIKGYGSSYRDLLGLIHPFQKEDLPAYLHPIYIGDVSAYVQPVPPSDLIGVLHGWAEIFLPAAINGQNYPWNLTASISSIGYYNNLLAIISPVRASFVNRNLIGIVHSWKTVDLTAEIGSINAGFLSAYLNPHGSSGDLHATIRPKMIRLSTYVSIPTMERLDLSAIINAACVYSGSENLGAYMYVKYKGDLNAYIRPLQYDYKPAYLSASTGYADAYTEIDKFKLRIIVKDSEFFTEDIYKVVIRTLSQEHYLGASIRGTLRYTDLTARVQAERLPTYIYESVSKNREKVINKTYDGVLTGYKVVELAFKDLVSDYHYSPAGDYAWKNNQFQRWMLSVKSYIPASVALNTYRKLYKATTLYNFSRFESFDAAMKHAIEYVTEQPLSDLGAVIYNRGRFTDLGATVDIRYTRNSRQTLAGSISGIKPSIIVGTSSGVQKI